MMKEFVLNKDLNQNWISQLKNELQEVKKIQREVKKAITESRDESSIKKLQKDTYR